MCRNCLEIFISNSVWYAKHLKIDLVDPLIKSGMLSFKEGKYYLNYEE